MLGGLGWMIGGNMAVGVMRADAARACAIEPEASEAALREPHVHGCGHHGAQVDAGLASLVERRGRPGGRPRLR